MKGSEFPLLPPSPSSPPPTSGGREGTGGSYKGRDTRHKAETLLAKAQPGINSGVRLTSTMSICGNFPKDSIFLAITVS